MTDPLLDSLNPEQRAAVVHDSGPLLILAGAGTGKTRVITHRIAYLIRERVARPHQILALTFTNKAAGEMKERAKRLVGPGSSGMILSTFHSTCARLLREFASLIGIERRFSIYDSDDQLSVIRRVAKELGMPFDKSAGKSYRHRIEAAKNAALRVSEVHEQARGREGELFADLFESYQAALQRANAFDFGDLVARVVHALEDDDRLRESIRRRFQVVMVDEFQDTNVAQYRLLRALSPTDGNVAVVGDDDQSIYRWRGATVENVQRFRDDYECQTIALEQNYRSTTSILEVAHSVVERLESRLEKKLRTDRPDTEPIRVFIGSDDREEAEFIARDIELGRRERGLTYDDFAIFYRTNAQSRILEEKLRGAGVPHVVIGGVSFFERAEIKDLLAYLRLAVNPADDVAFQRIVNTPSRGIGQATLSQIIRFREEAGLASLCDALDAFATEPQGRLQKKTREGLRSLRDLLATLRRISESASPLQLLDTVITETDFEGHLESRDAESAEDRLRNVDELRNAASEFTAENEDTTLSAFLEYTALRQSNDEDDENAAHVRLMTVHSAKGLEFPVVYVTGLEDGQFPLSRHGRVQSLEEADEERRLCYVALTRAEDRLTLTAAMRRRLHGQTRWSDPSEFLLELEEADLVLLPSSASESLDWRSRNRRGGKRDSKSTEPSFDEFDQRPWQERLGMEPSVPEDGVVFDDSFYPQDSVDAARKYIGKTARHRIFGEGKITDADPAGDRVRLTIDFEGVGEKKVVLQYVEIVA